MREAVRQDPEFGYVRSFTTRAKRDSENSSYDHVSVEDIEQLRRSGEIVTEVSFPATNDIYGTTPNSYGATFNLLDTLSHTVDTYQSLPFKTTLTVIVTADPTDWQTWFDERFPIGHEKRTARLREAKQSIEWSLNHEAEHAWLVNQPGRAAERAAQLIAFARGETTISEDGPKTAMAMLRVVKNLLSYE